MARNIKRNKWEHVGPSTAKMYVWALEILWQYVRLQKLRVSWQSIHQELQVSNVYIEESPVGDG